MTNSWWASLQPREQRVVALGAAVAVVLLGWSLLWYPLAHSRTQLAERVRQQHENLAAMSQQAAQARELRARGGGGHADRQGKSLLALADATARGAGLGGALKRVEPTSEKSVRVSFEFAAFDTLTNWLDALVRDYDVQTTDFSADHVDAVGLVNARVTLQEP